MKVGKRETSLAVSTPTAVMHKLNLNHGDEIEITVIGNGSIQVARASSAKESLKTLRRFRGAMPMGFKFDREVANAR